MPTTPTKVYTNILIIFACLTAVLLSHEKANIPTVDLAVARFLALAVTLLVVWVRILARTNKNAACAAKKELPEEAQQASKKLMFHEVIWTLLVPWFLLFLDRVCCQTDLLRTDNFDKTVAYFVTPHLFFFQVQIILEAVLEMTKANHSYPWLLFDYTVVANTYRGIPLGTSLLRSLYALPVMQLYNVQHWVVLVVQPIMTAVLWMYSTLVFVPQIWHPALVQQEQQPDKNPATGAVQESKVHVE